jgi:hypothetical protein
LQGKSPIAGALSFAALGSEQEMGGFDGHIRINLAQRGGNSSEYIRLSSRSS